VLFNSHVFILVFLPLTLAVFLVIGGAGGGRPARLWLLGMSLVFYGWWSPSFLVLLLASIGANHAFGRAIAAARVARPRLAQWLMVAGIAGNLALLAWYKYAAFVTGNVAALTGLDFTLQAVALPLAISFYTFQQIAFLSDARRGDAPAYGLVDYALFVTFFPQLIAGPIVHHDELVPQLRGVRRPEPEDVAAGLAFFVLGLLKKLAIADPVGALATPTFAAAGTPGALEAWLAVSAFTIGLYFDFSGYSDMAVGLARMFGIRLPYNFASPYQAGSIIEFWRRWHMTLSRFLRDYVYIPLGGNRHGVARRHANLMLTMLLGGLWHGAAWTFVAWGALHGFYLLLNHAWNGAAARAAAAGRRLALPRGGGQALTLLAAMVAWVFFAAPDFEVALGVLQGMAGLNGIGPRPPVLGTLVDVALGRMAPELEGEAGFPALLARAAALGALALGWLVVLVAPNSQEVVDGLPRRLSGAPWPALRFRPSPAVAVVAAAGFLFALSLMADTREFVYFQF
jgi:D-alanyl-lipoteichoic acid acyltransferase DltB (MBOAT superfamily)